MASTAPATPAHKQANPWVILTFLCLGFFMILLDSTIVNIAVPSIIDTFNAPLDSLLWVLNSYILVYAVLLITAGRLGDLWGQKWVFIAGLVLFVIGSVLCGIAPNISLLVSARVLQGIGGALLTPQTLAMITTVFPPERRGAAFGVWGAIAGAAAVAGPTLGGLIVTTIGWRWIFFVNVPVGIVTIIGSLIYLPSAKFGRQHTFDWIGTALVSLGLLAIVYALIEGQRYHWGTIHAPITIPEILVVGVVLLVAFVIFENGQKEPLIPTTLFKDRNYSASSLVGGALMFALMGFFLPLVIYLQSVLNMTALHAGLTIAPMAVVAMIMAAPMGRLADHLGGKYILMTGMILFGIGLAIIIATATPTTTTLQFFPGLIIAGLGMGCTFAPLSTIAMRDIPPSLAGSASSVLVTVRQVGAVIGSAVIGAILQTEIAKDLPQQARIYAKQLPTSIPHAPASVPALIHARFLGAFANVVSNGLQVGRGQNGAQIPPSVPAAYRPLLERLASDVFDHGYVLAMRPALSVCVGVLIVAGLSCFIIRRTPKGSERFQHNEGHATAKAPAPPEPVPPVLAD